MKLNNSSAFSSQEYMNPMTQLNTDAKLEYWLFFNADMCFVCYNNTNL